MEQVQALNSVELNPEPMDLNLALSLSLHKVQTLNPSLNLVQTDRYLLNPIQTVEPDLNSIIDTVLVSLDLTLGRSVSLTIHSLS